MIAVALAACSRAEAVPPAALQPPPGWQALPEIAGAAGDAAKGEGITVDAASAYGDPAMGCYALAITVHGAPGTPEAVVQAITQGLGPVRDVAAGSAAVALAFDKSGYHGKLRAKLGEGGGIEALACFWNDREPEACAKACEAVLK